MAVLSEDWGPYTGAPDAAAFLSRFVDKACGHDVGIVWAANGVIYPLRAPRRDGDGIGVVAVFEWTRSPPPPPKPPSGFWAKTRAFFESVMEAQGKAAIAEAQANMAMSQALVQGMKYLTSHHGDDAVGVAIDVIGVVVFIALLPTGVSELAAIGAAGGAILLVTDGIAYGREMTGDEEGAQGFKEQTESLRIIATIMTLGDIFYGGYKAIREFKEVRELRFIDRSTANASGKLAERTATAARAERYAQIAERANLRAQIRTHQIVASLKLEMAPRIAGLGGLHLMLREEIANDDSLMHKLATRFKVSCIGTTGGKKQ